MLTSAPLSRPIDSTNSRKVDTPSRPTKYEFTFSRKSAVSPTTAFTLRNAESCFERILISLTKTDTRSFFFFTSKNKNTQSASAARLRNARTKIHCFIFPNAFMIDGLQRIAKRQRKVHLGVLGEVRGRYFDLLKSPALLKGSRKLHKRGAGFRSPADLDEHVASRSIRNGNRGNVHPCRLFRYNRVQSGIKI